MGGSQARLYAALLLLSLVGALTIYLIDLDVWSGELSTWLAARRYAWYAPLLVVAAFVVFSVVPVMLLVSLTGVAFGPVLGPLYAMAGCLASASTAFAVGRWMGRHHVSGWEGEHAARVMQALRRNGTLAVFLIRKIPVPFALVNVLLGASAVRYREFIVGTALGMAAMVLALAGFGHYLADVWIHPTMDGVVRALLFLTIPLTLAWWLGRRLRARSGHASGS